MALSKQIGVPEIITVATSVFQFKKYVNNDKYKYGLTPEQVPRIEGFDDFEPYHFSWLYQTVPDQNFKLEQVHLHLQLNVAKEKSAEEGQQVMQEIQRRARDKIANEQFMDGCTLISRFGMRESFDLFDLCKNMLRKDEKNMQAVRLLIGKDCGWDTEKCKAVGYRLIEFFMQPNFAQQYYKMLKTLCDIFSVNVSDYPVLVEILKQKTVGFHIHSYLHKKITDPDWKGLDKLEDLLEGKDYELAVLVASLIRHNRPHEAKGVYLRHKIPEEIFKNSATDVVSQKTLNVLENTKYNPE